MRRKRQIAWIVAGVIVAAIASRLVYTHRTPGKPVVLIGAVVRRDPDPRRQAPVANARITALDGTMEGNAKSDASGLFKLKVTPLTPDQPITLKFEHEGYKPEDVQASPKSQLYVVRMDPLVREGITGSDHEEAPAKAVSIAHVRLRYSVRNRTTNNVGSVTKQFEVVNIGNMPCRSHPPCSPDGKWKAATATITLDAQKGNEFHDVRTSCVAGPCPFTRIEPSALPMPARKVQITVVDWSDTASFLVEAEVTRTMTSDRVVQSYPFITGQTISFALPDAAEGPSLIADVDGEEIVFPLGPNLILSWTTCSVEIAQGGNRLYRCELKPGYRVQE